jgi:hypothetical protein
VSRQLAIIIGGGAIGAVAIAVVVAVAFAFTRAGHTTQAKTIDAQVTATRTGAPAASPPTQTATALVAVVPTPMPMVPTRVVVDDLDPGFVRGGPSAECPSEGADGTSWHWCWETHPYQGDLPYAGHYWYTSNGVGSLGDLNYGRWRPNLPLRADYRVCAWIAPRHAFTTDARYRIQYAGGTAEVDENQKLLSGWVDLGVYPFDSGTAGNVYLGDGTDEPYGASEIGYDAMEWVPPSAGGC